MRNAHILGIVSFRVKIFDRRIFYLDEFIFFWNAVIFYLDEFISFWNAVICYLDEFINRGLLISLLRM